ncbi:MAG: hypothetical protein Q7R60_03030 [bacterium]|nr:hypothetical protein [bacterium]
MTETDRLRRGLADQPVRWHMSAAEMQNMTPEQLEITEKLARLYDLAMLQADSIRTDYPLRPEDIEDMLNPPATADEV